MPTKSGKSAKYVSQPCDSPVAFARRTGTVTSKIWMLKKLTAPRIVARRNGRVVDDGGLEIQCTPEEQPPGFRIVASGPSTLNEDQIAERGARLARRDD